MRGFEGHGGPDRRPGRVAAAMWSGSRSRLTTSATVRSAEAACFTTRSGTRPLSSFATAAGRRLVGRRPWESEPVVTAQEAAPDLPIRQAALCGVEAPNGQRPGVWSR